jgi:polyisoprenyl-teichoic acid--peptidoglycan teichoic acid transferase
MQQPHRSASDRDNKQFQNLSQTYYQPASQQQAAHQPPEPIRKKRRWGRWLLLAIVLLITPIIIAGVWSLRSLSGASEQLFGTSNVLGFVPTMPLKTDANGRTNILIVGYSIDRTNGGGGSLTDSILVLSVHKQREDAFMLSVPRDLYVDIGGSGYARINEAFQDGEAIDFEASGYSDGGMGLLEKVIQDTLGIKAHYHALVDYAAVEEIVDALGGIDVVIDSPDERGIYDPNFLPEEGGPLQLDNGVQSIDGQTALKLVRARGSAGGYGFPRSDFNRTQNQQQVVIGIKNQLDIRDILDPRTNSAMLDAIASNISTNVVQQEAIPMSRLILGINTDTIRSYTLADIDDRNLLQGYTTQFGSSVLIPAAGFDDYSEIQAEIQRLSRQ